MRRRRRRKWGGWGDTLLEGPTGTQCLGRFLHPTRLCLRVRTRIQTSFIYLFRHHSFSYVNSGIIRLSIHWLLPMVSPLSRILISSLLSVLSLLLAITYYHCFYFYYDYCCQCHYVSVRRAFWMDPLGDLVHFLHPAGIYVERDRSYHQHGCHACTPAMAVPEQQRKPG